MKPAAFEYHRPKSIDGALRLLHQLGDEAKVIAGGQSLVPLMNLRLATPAHLIDLRYLDALRGVSVGPGELVVGAMTTYAEVEDDPLIEPSVPLLSKAVPRVGHRSIRHRGTIGGSLAHADPAAEVPAVALALEARINTASVDGTRTIAASEFFLGPYMTALKENELILSAALPTAGPEHRSGIFDVTRRPGDYALAGLACAVTLNANLVSDARLVGFATGPTPYRLRDTEAVLEGVRVTDDVEADALLAASRDMDRVRSADETFDYEHHATLALIRRVLRWLRTGGRA